MAFVNETVIVNLGPDNPPYQVVHHDDPLLTTSVSVVQNSSHDAVNHTNTEFGAIISISLMFCVIGLLGIIGNTMIIFIILLDRKMRRSVTNLFIMNLAISDLLIMLFGVPETVQFMLNRGWLLGDIMCKTERYVLVVSLYSSVVTSVAVCVERYIAIVHPMKAHLLCSRKKMTLAITLMWPSVFLLGLPVVLFNQLVPRQDVQFCQLMFPHGHIMFFIIFKYVEFSLFYLIPMILQVVCYSIISHRLFAGSRELHRKTWSENGSRKEAVSEAMRARKGVVKMLMVSVTIYFISYSPHQVLLIYNTFSRARFEQTWLFLVFVTAMGYINSAANPILYCIFSQKFRTKFKAVLLFCVPARRGNTTGQAVMSGDHNTDSGVVLSSFRRSSRSLLQSEVQTGGKRLYGTCTKQAQGQKQTWL